MAFHPTLWASQTLLASFSFVLLPSLGRRSRRHHAKPYEATSSLEVDQCSAHPPQFAVATPLQIVELRNYYSRFITRLPPHSFPIYQTTGLAMSDLNFKNDNFQIASFFYFSSLSNSGKMDCFFNTTVRCSKNTFVHSNFDIFFLPQLPNRV